MCKACFYLYIFFASFSVTAGEVEELLSYSITDAISSKKILPDSQKSEFELSSHEIAIVAAKNEYEPASFVVRAGESDIDSLQISVSDLHSDGNVLLKANIDLKLVVPWFQADGAWKTHRKLGNGKVLIPELLLKDQQLVKVDIANKKNYLRLSKEHETEYIDISTDHNNSLSNFNIDSLPVKDAKKLKPIYIPKNTNQQIWVTVFVPRNQKAGTYIGAIKLFNQRQSIDIEIPIKLEVLDFELQPPDLEYSIYYRGKLSQQKATISSEFKNAEQLYNDMVDMKNHGVINPTVYQRFKPKKHRGDPATVNEARELLDKYLVIRNKVGLNSDSLYYLGRIVHEVGAKSGLNILKEDICELQDIKNKFGYANLYLYGIDESKGRELVSQKTLWSNVKKHGAKIFVAGDNNHFDLMKEYTDLLVHYGEPSNRVVEGVHKFNNKVFVYSDPQGGVENPMLNRKKFGFELWRSGVDGSMTYAYQANMGFAWNDFDHKVYRDHQFTYPSLDEPISTLAWEGYREGVDDVRYISTLKFYAGVIHRKEVDAVLNAIKEDESTAQRPPEIRSQLIHAINKVIDLQSGNSTL